MSIVIVQAVIKTVSFIIQAALLVIYGRFYKRNIPKFGKCLALMSVSVAGLLLSILERLDTSPEIYEILKVLRTVGLGFLNILFTQLLWLMSARDIDKAIKQQRLLYIYAVIVGILSITNPYHHLLMAADGTDYPLIGLLWIISVCTTFVVWAYLLVNLKNSMLSLKQSVMLAALSSLPTLFDIVDIYIIKPFVGVKIDLGNFGTSIALLFISYFYFGYLISSRNMAVQVMQEAYIVFDKRGTMTDTNQQAMNILKSDKIKSITRAQFVQLIGLPASTAVELIDNHEFAINLAGTERYFVIHTFNISNNISRDCGDGFIIREITEYREDVHRLSNMVAEDPLTHVKNRRYLLDKAPSLFVRAREKHQPLTLLMMDLDKFKAINDKHGHRIGDKVLMHFCQVCMRSIRKTDELVRYGGEEFVIVGEDIDAESGELLAMRICDNVRKTPLVVGSSVINVTVSIGGSTFVPGQEDSLEQWLQTVDEYLYMAKINGRDRVEYFRPAETDTSVGWFV